MATMTAAPVETKKRKSKAQLKRLMKRAEARGETYAYVPRVTESKEKEGDDEQCSTSDEKMNKKAKTKAKTNDDALAEIVSAYQIELKRIETDETLKSKDRRSAKRRAEAIALQESAAIQDDGSTSIAKLLEWYDKYQSKQEEQKSTTVGDNNGSKKKPNDKKKVNPYIVFVGQMSYQTTKEALYQHFAQELAKEFDNISPETVQIRLLTHKKNSNNNNNKQQHQNASSRGMAFVQVADPQILYACLRLHHTHLEGRRINVERSAGGKGDKRLEKLQQLRQEQSQHIVSVVDGILQECYDNRSIQKGELDDGVVALCQRHSPAVVQAALQEYVDKQGRDMDNPSAYLTFLLGKMAVEGIRDKEEKEGGKDSKGGASSRNPKRSSYGGGDGGQDSKKKENGANPTAKQ